MRSEDWKWRVPFVLVTATATIVAGPLLVRVALTAAWGDMDPASLAVGLVSLAVAVISWRSSSIQGSRADARDSADVIATARLLAIQVRKREEKARRQMLQDVRVMDLRLRLVPAPAFNAGNADQSTHLKQIASYFRVLEPRRMVITGAPGAGKTLAAVELALHLLEDFDAETDPVPIRVSASSLPDRGPVDDWLIAHITDNFPELRRTAVQALVAADRVLPMIDGLDELDRSTTPLYDSRAARVLHTLNDFQRGCERGAVIVTCRTDHYEYLQNSSRVWLSDSAALEIRPLEPLEIREYLKCRVADVERWAPVLDHLELLPDSTLSSHLSAPWRLGLAITMYEKRNPRTGDPILSPAALVSHAGAGPNALRDHLLSLAIPVTCFAAGDAFDEHSTHRWLGVLASDYLKAHAGRSLYGEPISASDVILHRLWPLARLWGGYGDFRSYALVTTLPVVALLLFFTSVNAPPAITFPMLAAVYLAFQIWRYKSGPSLGSPVPSRMSELRGPKTLRISRPAAAIPLLGSALIVALIHFRGWEIDLRYHLGIPAIGTTISGGLFIFSRPPRGEDDAISPRELLDLDRRDTFLELSTSLTSVIAAFLIVGFSWPMFLAIAVVLLSFLLLNSAIIRYWLVLARTRSRSRRPLPWQLPEFLDWCCSRGLMRVAGVAYQFRHKELQDYLTRNPLP